MAGFWATSEIKSKSDVKTELRIPECHKHECRVCPLNTRECKSPKMEPRGVSDPYVYILGAAPDERDDKNNRQFSGNYTKYVREALPRGYGTITRFNNIVRTLPFYKREITQIEVECCRPSIIRDIELTRPRVIIGVGKLPLQWLLGETIITRWRGRPVPVKVGRHVCWAFIVDDPQVFIPFRKRGFNSKEVIKSQPEKVFERDLTWIYDNVEKLKKPVIPEVEDLLDNVEYVTGSNKGDLEKVLNWLQEASHKQFVGVDLETSELRPYNTSSRLLTFAVGFGGRGFAFPLEHANSNFTNQARRKINAAIKSFLLSRRPVKIAHNLSFEQEWLAYIFGKEILRGSKWADTMAQSYVNDYRKGGLSLDDICLHRLGIRLKEISNVDTKNIESEPLEKVLKYNALDTILLPALFKKQDRELIERKSIDVYDEQIRRIPTIVLTQLKGLDVDQNVVLEYSEKYEKKFDEITVNIHSEDVIREFLRKEGRDFNPASNPDCVKVFKDYLKRSEGYTMAGIGYSTDESVLERIDHPLAELIVDYRQIAKIKSTYIDTLIEGGGKFLFPDGKIHPVFNSMFTDTRRLSSDSPNAQNFPKRKWREVRKQIVPPPNHTFVAVDYGQIEARVIAMFSKDRAFCTALWERFDVHTDWAERIAQAYPNILEDDEEDYSEKEAMKILRDQTKNKFVFPAFFGSSADSISRNFGIPREITKVLFEEFWETFPGVKKWQEKLLTNYEKYGYVETLTGFKRFAPLNYNRIINTPVQGTASDIVIDGMNRLSELAEKEGKEQYQPILNVHDDLSFCLPDATLEEDLEVVIGEMLGCPFEFINVPLTLEVEIGPNWYELEPLGDFSSDEFFT